MLVGSLKKVLGFGNSDWIKFVDKEGNIIKEVKGCDIPNDKELDDYPVSGFDVIEDAEHDQNEYDCEIRLDRTSIDLFLIRMRQLTRFLICPEFQVNKYAYTGDYREELKVVFKKLELEISKYWRG